MGMDFQNEMEKSMLSPEARQKFDELVVLLAEQQRIGESPPGADENDPRKIIAAVIG